MKGLEVEKQSIVTTLNHHRRIENSLAKVLSREKTFDNSFNQLMVTVL